MARENLKDFLKRSLKKADTISYNVAHEDKIKEGDDLGLDPNTGLPLISERSGLTGNFVEKITTETNQFHLKPNNQKFSAYKRGETLIHNNFDSFTKPGDLPSYSNSGHLETDNLKISDFLNKNGHKDKTAHSLYKSVSGSPLSKSNKVIIESNEDHPVLNLVSTNNKNKNRYSPGNEAFFGDNENQGTFDSGDSNSGVHTLQENMGSYDKDSRYRVSYNRLRKVGASMLLKMGGWDNSDSPGASGDPEEFEFKNSTFASGKVEQSSIKSSNAYGAPANDLGQSPKSNKDRRLKERNKVQKAFFNNEFRFSNIKNHELYRMKTVIAMRTIVNTLITYISAIKDFSTGRYNGPGPHIYGSYSVSSNAVIDFIEKNALVYTVYGYEKSIDTGLSIFFGIDSTESQIKVNEKIVEQSNFLKGTKSYWISIAYSFIRKIEDADIFNIKQEEDVASNLMSFIENLNRTKILGLMNTIATMGDIYLRSSGGKTTFEYSEKTIRPFDVDSYPDLPGHRVSKSRKKRGIDSLENAISSRDLPSAYLLPTNIIKASLQLDKIFSGQNPAKGMLGSTLVDKVYLGNNLDGSFNRIPQSTVKEIEDRLESEYLPFYIQDLRTNEVIAFHGFLNDLSDKYNTEYEKTTGYGRMDSVHHIKATSRTVTLSFSLFATNKKDYDEMWYKINKLVTLIYPQWTQGDMLSNSSGGKYVQPMSQVIGATPVVRLRVGDVIKSNYSRFNLARTFGIGDVGVKPVYGKDSEPDSGIGGGFINALQSINTNLADTKYYDAILSIFMFLYGSPTSFLQTKPDSNKYVKLAASALDELSKQFLVNGFANPLGVEAVLSQITSPDVIDDPSLNYKPKTTKDKFKKIGKMLQNPQSGNLIPKLGKGYTLGTSMKLQPSYGKGYKFISSDGVEEQIYTSHEINVILLDYYKGSTPTSITNIKENFKNRKSATTRESTFLEDPKIAYEGIFRGERRTNFNSTRTLYEVLVVNDSDPYLNLGTFLVYHEDLLPDYNSIFNSRVAPLLSIADPISSIRSGIKTVAKKAAANLNVSTDKVESLLNSIPTNTPASFMDPVNNPVTRAFESNMGRGLAGVLGGIDFKWIDEKFGWETTYNSKAPKGVDISLSLEVIHDIPPGLDHSGFNRAPLYNVGGIMKHVAGDPNNREENREKRFKDGNVGHAKRFKDEK